MKKKLYAFRNNSIWIIEGTSVRYSFPDDLTNPSASLFTSTKSSQVKSLLGKENNFAVKNLCSANLLDSRHKVIKVRFCFYDLWRDYETRKTSQDFMLWEILCKGRSVRCSWVSPQEGRSQGVSLIESQIPFLLYFRYLQFHTRLLSVFVNVRN